jgi:hypothetical protein
MSYPSESEPFRQAQERFEAVGSGQNSLSQQSTLDHPSGRQRSSAASSGIGSATQNATQSLPDDLDVEGVVSNLRSGWANLSAAEKAEWISRAAMVRKARSEE